MESNNRTRRRRQKKGTRANDRRTLTPPDVTGQMSDRTSTDVSGQLSYRTSTDVNGQMSDGTSTDVSGRMSDRTSTDVNGQMSDGTSTDVSGRVSDRTSTDVSGRMSDRTSTDVSGRMSDRTSTDVAGQLNDRTSMDVNGQMSDRTSTDVAGQLNDRTSMDVNGQMSDRTSTDVNGQLSDRTSMDVAGQLSDRTSTDVNGQLSDRTSSSSSSMTVSPAVGAGGRRLAVVRCPSPSNVGLSLPGVMDAEGRVDESRLRMHIFKNGGVSPASQRGAAWRFLFGMYPCSSTALERPLLQEQLAVRYQVMKRKWQQVLPSSVRLRLNGTDAELVLAVRYFDQRQAEDRLQGHDQNPEVRDRLAFLELQAQVLFERVTFDLEEVQEAIRMIDKDVPRTNRDLDYYLGEGSGNLLVLRDILITYAAFHPEVSYAQGMNDLCSRFLEVLDCEVDAFWSFCCYMDKFYQDFRADGLHRKIELEAALLKQLDPQLHKHLVTDSMESFTFCHRWLLLGFQREFEPSDALRLFELLSCDHLEFISQQVERARYQERLARKRCCAVVEETSGPEPHTINTDFTFELFICATILIDNRDSLLRCRDDMQLIQFTSSLQGTLDLNCTLHRAEEHFYNYCKRSAWDYMGGCCRARRHKNDHFLYQLRSLFF